MNFFKKLRTRYFELRDYIDESEYVLINKKGKEEYLRLYPKYAKKHTFTEMEFGENYIKVLEYRYSESSGVFELINEWIDSEDNREETCIFGYFLEKSMLQDFEKP